MTDSVDQLHLVDPVQRRFCHAVISAMTFSVILEMASLETRSPKTSPKCAVITPVVRPYRAQRQHDLVDARQPPMSFLHDLRSNVDPVSRGTSISTGRSRSRRSCVPLREFPLPRPDTSRCRNRGAVHLDFQSGLQDILRHPVQQPAPGRRARSPAPWTVPGAAELTLADPFQSPMGSMVSLMISPHRPACRQRRSTYSDTRFSTTVGSIW